MLTRTNHVTVHESGNISEYGFKSNQSHESTFTEHWCVSVVTFVQLNDEDTEDHQTHSVVPVMIK